MIWIDILMVILIAAILSGALAWGFSWRHPAKPEGMGVSFLFLFIVLALTIWAASLWIEPVGPVLYGVHWLGSVIVGIVLALLLLAIGAPTPNSRRLEPSEEAKEEDVSASAFRISFWLLIIGLLILGIGNYYFFPD